MVYKWCVFFISIVGQPGQKESLLLELELLLLLLFFEAILVSKAHSHLQMEHVHIPRLISGCPGETCLPNWTWIIFQSGHLIIIFCSLEIDLMFGMILQSCCPVIYGDSLLGRHHLSRCDHVILLILILCLRYVWLQQSGNNIIVATSAGMIDTGLKLNSDIEQNKRMLNHVHQTSCQHLGCEAFGVSCGLSWMLMQTIIFWVVWWANEFVWLKYNAV